MRIPRVLLPTVLRAGDEHELPPGAFDHLVRVLRLAVGRPLRVFDGRGVEFHATLVEVGKRGARVCLGDAAAALAPSPLRITLAQGLARGEKMDWILQKATETGVAAIQPLQTERTEVRLDEERGERRMAHWRGVVIGACEQCGRAELPELSPPMALVDWLALKLAEPVAGQVRVFLDPEGSVGMDSCKVVPASLLAVVGPEGGFSERERSLFTRAGFTGWRLGPRILRTETAGIALLAVAQAKWGDLAN